VEARWYELPTPLLDIVYMIQVLGFQLKTKLRMILLYMGMEELLVIVLYTKLVLKEYELLLRV
jgi:hypothetical protein